MPRLRRVPVLALALIAFPADGDAAGPLDASRLRRQSTRIGGWLSLGLEHSPTIRALADHVARGDVGRTFDTVAALRAGDLARLEMVRGAAASGA